MFRTFITTLASVNTIWAMRLAGRSDQRFNIVGLANCVIWTIFTVITASWPLMILNTALAHTYTTNLIKWRKNG